MASESRGLLGVHVRVGQGLRVGTTPRVEVHWERVGRLLEELALPRGHDAARLVLLAFGVPHLDPERSLEVAPEGLRVARLDLRLTCPLAAPSGEEEALGGP